MECKETVGDVSFITRWRINRNIVECKAQRITVKTCIVSVLIETLWNVKAYAPVLPGISGTVLIETLWNVKKELETISLKPFHVLIETLWNVKEF